MNERTKESKFLDAINQYAEKQKATISAEVEEYKNQRIEQATEQGLSDAYNLIQRDIAKQKADIVIETAAKENALRKRQFELRQKIHDEVFKKAWEKLLAFTESDQYADSLKRSAENAKELFGGKAVVISTAPKDAKYAELIKSVFSEADIREDKDILIGGIKVYCKETGILADDTLDSKLHDQHEWFIEHSGLKVV